MATIGERLFALREARGLTRTDLASKAGISSQALYAIETGGSKQPSFTVGVRLARALGVSAAELAFGEEAATPPADPLQVVEARLEARFEELRKEVLGIADRQERSIRAVADELSRPRPRSAVPAAHRRAQGEAG